jgi:KDO2-lipid IV(A) lauroyltransferase
MLAALPLAFLYSVASVIGWLAFRVFPYRKELVHNNLRLAFPEMDEKALRETMRRYYLGFAHMFVEIVKSASMTPEEIRRRVRIVNLEAPLELLARGTSVLCVAAHQCNWEWMLLGFSLELEYPVDAAYKPLGRAGDEDGPQPLWLPPDSSQGVATGHHQAPRYCARHCDGRRSGAHHQ